MSVTTIGTEEGALGEAATMLLETVLPDTADPDGTLFGGNALRLMGKAALAAARCHTNGKVMMTGANGVRFHQPVPVGHLLELTARVIHTNEAAMTILVDGMVQSPAGSRRTLALSGYLQMTVLDGTAQNGSKSR
jgi:acyl-CoA hydrolase